MCGFSGLPLDPHAAAVTQQYVHGTDEFAGRQRKGALLSVGLRFGLLPLVVPAVLRVVHYDTESSLDEVVA